MVDYPGKTPFQKEFGGKLFSGLSGIIPFPIKKPDKIVVPNNVKK